MSRLTDDHRPTPSSDHLPVAASATGLSVAVVGTGYVGLTTGACLAHLGHHVVCADIDADKIERLERGELPIHEAGLDTIVAGARAVGRLTYCVGASHAVPDADIVLLCVPTPQGEDGSADLSYIEAAAREIGPALRTSAIVVNKSTVPVGSTKVVERALGRPDVHVASNPEFLREGVAVHDFLHPARVVIGADDTATRLRVAELYEQLDGEIFLTDAATAETIKYAANAFLATKISFINDMSHFCESIGADVRGVADAIGMDPRIGRGFLDAGPGWGGSCFPKDSRALVSIAADHGFDFQLMRSVIAANDEHQRRIVQRIVRAVGREAEGGLSGVRVAVLGLTFKAGTDDLRASPSLQIAGSLAQLGATVSGFDPTVGDPIDATTSRQLGPIAVHPTPVAAATDADIVVVLTEWHEFRQLDLADIADVMSGDVLFDARDVIDQQRAEDAGLRFLQLGTAD